MNIKILSTISAIAIAMVASAPVSLAKVYSPSQFTAELKKKVGTKTGSAATKAAASLLKSALSDKKNSVNAEKYSKSIVSLLKKVVKTDQGTAANTLVSSLLAGYFKPVKFSLSNATYNKALVALLKILPASQKTAPVSQKIYNTIKNFAKNTSSQTDMFNYWNNTVAPKSGLLKAPPVTS